MPVIRKVPLRSCQIPNFGSAANSGPQESSVKNLLPTSSKNGIESASSATMMPERRQDADRRREEQQGADDLLAPAAALDAERGPPSRRRALRLCSGFHLNLDAASAAPRLPYEPTAPSTAVLASPACVSSIGTISAASAIVS